VKVLELHFVFFFQSRLWPSPSARPSDIPFSHPFCSGALPSVPPPSKLFFCHFLRTVRWKSSWFDVPLFFFPLHVFFCDHARLLSCSLDVADPFCTTRPELPAFLLHPLPFLLPPFLFYFCLKKLFFALSSLAKLVHSFSFPRTPIRPLVLSENPFLPS